MKEDVKKNINKKELINLVAQKVDSTKSQATEIIDACFETIRESIASGMNVQINGFGSFKLMSRAATTGRNPRTGEAIKIGASVHPKFSASQTLKDEVKKAYSKSGSASKKK